MLMAAGSEGDATVYAPKYEAQSHSRNLGHVRQFGSLIGRVEISKSGARSAAAGERPSHWYPQKPPPDGLTRPRSASSGVPFTKQITRKQDVNGKLLEDNQMTRFLFGGDGDSGTEYY